MKTISAPLKLPHDQAANNADYVIEQAKIMTDGRRPGILATVDERGLPHLRWMGALTSRDWPRLYTMTSPTSRKVHHIFDHPSVSWMFSNEDLSIIINLRGKAQVTTDFEKVERVWNLIEDKSKAYCLNMSTEGNLAVIETEIEEVDCVMPRYEIKFQAHHADL